MLLGIMLGRSSDGQGVKQLTTGIIWDHMGTEYTDLTAMWDAGLMMK